jgi:H+/gluconate symporter-like permease
LIGIVIAVLGSVYLTRAVQKAKENGETFSLPYRHEAIANEAANEIASTLEETESRTLPHIVCALFNYCHHFIEYIGEVYFFDIGGSRFACSWNVLCWVLNAKFIRKFWESMAVGAQDALVVAANTCAVVGFGTVAKNVPAFQTAVNALVHLPGPDLLGLALGVTIICGMTGSASGGLGIALPILAPIYMAKGLDPGAMHRVSALASGGLDSLPYNGYIVTTIRAVCHEIHERTYKPVFVLSVVIPLIGMFLAVILYSIF